MVDAVIPQQSDTQRKAAYDAAGLTPTEQSNVDAGVQSAPRYSRLTPTADAAAAPTYDSELNTSRAAEIARQQGQFDAIEKTFNNELTTSLAREEEIGQRDVARSNTISAMAGMGGSPDATTREGNADRRTTDRKNAVTADVSARKSAALSSLYARIDQNASDSAKINLQTKRDEQAKLQETTAKNALNNILSFAGDHGVNWSTFSQAYNNDKTLQDEVGRSGKTMPELYELYTSTLPTPPKKEYAWRGDNLVSIETDPLTGKTSTQTFDATSLGIPKGTDFQAVTLGKSVYWIDKKDPFNADGSPKMTRMGASAVTGKEKATPVAIPSYDDFYKEFLQTPQGQQLAKEHGGDNIALSKALKTLYETAKTQTLESGGGSDHDKGRQVIETSSSKDWNTLRSALMEKTKLNAGEIDALLLAQGIKKPKTAAADSSNMTDEEFMAFISGAGKAE